MIILPLYQVFLASNVSTQRHKQLRKKMLSGDFFVKPLCTFGKAGKEVEIRDTLFSHELKVSALVFPCHLAINKLLLGCERFYGNE